MDKTLRLLFVFGLIFFISCEDLIDELIGPTVYLWGVDYSIKNTTELDLSRSKLTGDIPPEIGDLTNLRTLDLSHSHLSGGIPPEIGNLTNLTHLDLRYNQLTGSIPPEIGNMTNLRYLYLNDNQLTGEIPESICNVNNGNLYSSWNPKVTVQRNQLCPPYPSCIGNVGEQDTSDCD